LGFELVVLGTELVVLSVGLVEFGVGLLKVVAELRFVINFIFVVVVLNYTGEVRVSGGNWVM
jgi:hypothetical protein